MAFENGGNCIPLSAKTTDQYNMARRSPSPGLRHPHGSYYLRVRSRRYNCGRDFRAAGKKAKKYLRDIAAGRIAVDGVQTTQVTTHDGKPDISLAELAHRHLEWVKDKRAEGTYISRRRYVNCFLRYAGVTTMVSQLTTDLMERYYELAKKKHGNGPNRGNFAFREVRTMLLWGQERELCEIPYRRRVEIDKVRPTPKAFAAEELLKLLAAAPADFADLILFAVLTGLRPQELRGLRREHVVEKVLPLADGTMERRSVVVLDEHKTARSTKDEDKKPRTIPLSPRAAEIVCRQLANHPESELVFVNDDGGAYERTALRNRLIRWCRRAKIPQRSPYALRHTFATLQCDWETSGSFALQELMGHNRADTTKGYVSNCSLAHRRAVDSMDGILLKLTQKPQAEAADGQKKT